MNASSEPSPPPYRPVDEAKARRRARQRRIRRLGRQAGQTHLATESQRARRQLNALSHDRSHRAVALDLPRDARLDLDGPNHLSSPPFFPRLPLRQAGRIAKVCVPARSLFRGAHDGRVLGHLAVARRQELGEGAVWKLPKAYPDLLTLLVGNAADQWESVAASKGMRAGCSRADGERRGRTRGS